MNTINFQTPHKRGDSNQTIHSNEELIKTNPLTLLPFEMLLLVFSKLNYDSWNSLSLTNKNFRKLCYDSQSIAALLENDDLNIPFVKYIKLVQLAGIYLKRFVLRDLKFYKLETFQNIIKTCPNIEKLKLDYCIDYKMKDNHLEQLKGLCSLQSLALHGPRITDEGIKHLETLSHLQFLKLSCCGNKLTDTSLLYLKRLIFLRSLELHSQKITNIGLEQLTALSSLQFLNLTCCDKITDAGLVHLKVLPLQSLNLSRCSEITDDGLVHIGMINSLYFLSINDCKKITNVGLKSLQLLSSLQSLELSHCFGILSLENLKPLSSLQSLNLSHCINFKDLESIKEFVSLQSLTIRGGFCQHEFIDAIHSLKALPRLQSLDISYGLKGGIITDDTLEHLKELRFLQFLYLAMCNDITDNGLKHLKALEYLRFVDLSHCSEITYYGIQQLKKDCPLLTIQCEKN